MASRPNIAIAQRLEREFCADLDDARVTIAGNLSECRRGSERYSYTIGIRVIERVSSLSTQLELVTLMESTRSKPGPRTTPRPAFPGRCIPAGTFWKHAVLNHWKRVRAPP